MPLAHYLVEISPPEGGWEAVHELTQRGRVASAELRRAGTPIRLLRSISVPEDGACFLLYEGPSLEVVEEAARQATEAVLGTRRAKELSGGSSEDQLSGGAGTDEVRATQPTSSHPAANA